MWLRKRSSRPGRRDSTWPTRLALLAGCAGLLGTWFGTSDGSTREKPPTRWLKGTAADEQASVEDQTIAAEEADFLWTVLERIPDNYREPLVLYYREEASIADVAKAMDVSEDVVRQRLSRGRKMLEERVTAMVEGTLGKRRTPKEFAAGVFVAIQASPGAKAAGGAITAAAANVPAGFLGFLLGPAIGIAGAIFGSKKSLDSATSDVERRFMWKMIIGITLLVGLLFAAEYTMSSWLPAGARGAGHAIIWMAYAFVLTTSIVWSNARIQKIKQEHGTDAEREMIAERSKPAPAKAAAWNLIGSIASVDSISSLPSPISVQVKSRRSTSNGCGVPAWCIGMT